VRENVKSLSNSVTKFCDQGICEEFHFFRHYFPSLILLFLVVKRVPREYNSVGRNIALYMQRPGFETWIPHLFTIKGWIERKVNFSAHSIS